MAIFPGELVEARDGKLIKPRIRALFGAGNSNPTEFKNSTQLPDEVAANVLFAVKDMNVELQPLNFVEVVLNSGLHPDYWQPLCAFFGIEPPELPKKKQTALAIFIWSEPFKFTTEVEVSVTSFAPKEAAIRAAKPIGSIPTSILLISDNVVVASFMVGKDF